MPPVVLVFFTEFLPYRTTNGLPSFIPWIIAEHLGGSYRPEAHMSTRYGTEPDCHNRASVPFWLMRINLLSHVLLHDPSNESSPFGSPYVLFPSGLELSGSVLHLIVL